MNKLVAIIYILIFMYFGVVIAQKNIEKLYATFREIQIDGKTGFKGTYSFLKCHENVAEGMLPSSHWLWKEHNNSHKSEKIIEMNNFCISVLPNELRYIGSYIDYGWKDKLFDFTKAEIIDCMVCEHRNRAYKKS